jgi:hypothetical protein
MASIGEDDDDDRDLAGELSYNRADDCRKGLTIAGA